MNSKQIKEFLVKKITILITRGTGQVYTTEIVPWHILTVLCIIIGVVIYVLITSIGHYRAAVEQRDLLAQRLAALETREKENPDELESSPLMPGSDQPLELEVTGAPPSADSLSPSDHQRVEPKPARKYETLGVEQVKLSWARGPAGQTLLNFSFKLVNRAMDNQLHSGYVIVVARNLNTQFGGVYMAYPPMELRLGFPVDYRKGDRFAIRRFKFVEGSIEHPADRPPFNELVIYAFSNQGSLLLREVLQIGAL